MGDAITGEVANMTKPLVIEEQGLPGSSKVLVGLIDAGTTGTFGVGRSRPAAIRSSGSCVSQQTRKGAKRQNQSLNPL